MTPPAVEHHPVLIAVELQTHLSFLLVMVAVVMDEETGTFRMVMYCHLELILFHRSVGMPGG